MPAGGRRSRGRKWSEIQLSAKCPRPGEISKQKEPPRGQGWKPGDGSGEAWGGVGGDRLRDKIKDAYILPEIMGSDHCPVGLDITW